jgi:hypothetical protein
MTDQKRCIVWIESKDPLYSAQMILDQLRDTCIDLELRLGCKIDCYEDEIV